MADEEEKEEPENPSESLIFPSNSSSAPAVCPLRLFSLQMLALQKQDAVAAAAAAADNAAADDGVAAHVVADEAREFVAASGRFSAPPHPRHFRRRLRDDFRDSSSSHGT